MDPARACEGNSNSLSFAAPASVGRGLTHTSHATVHAPSGGAVGFGAASGLRPKAGIPDWPWYYSWSILEAVVTSYCTGNTGGIKGGIHGPTSLGPPTPARRQRGWKRKLAVQGSSAQGGGARAHDLFINHDWVSGRGSTFIGQLAG